MKKLLDKLLKKFLLTLVVFTFGLIATAQVDTTRLRQKINAYGYDYNNIGILGSFRPPPDTFRLAIADTGSIAVIGNVMYVWNLNAGVLRWEVISGSGLGQNLSNAALTANGNYAHNWDNYQLAISDIGYLELISGSGNKYSQLVGDSNSLALQHATTPGILSEIIVGEASSKPYILLTAQDDDSDFPQQGHRISVWQDSIVFRSKRNNDTTQIYLGALMPVGDTTDYVLTMTADGRVKRVPGTLFGASDDPTAIFKNANYGGYDIINFYSAFDSVIAKQFFAGTNITIDTTEFGVTINSTASGNNMANADLTLTDHRAHDLNTKELIISGGGPVLTMSPKLSMGNYLSVASLATGYDTSFNMSAAMTATAAPSLSQVQMTTSYANAANAASSFNFSSSASGAATAQTGASNASGRSANVNYSVDIYTSSLQFDFGINPSLLIGSALGTTAAIDSNKNIFPLVSRDTVLTWNPVTARVERTVVTGGAGGTDTLYYANVGASGVTLAHGVNDSLYFNKLIAGSNITLPKGTDSAITINAVPGGIVNSVQFNDNGVLNGFAQLFYDPATDKFWLSNALRYPEGQSRYTIADSSNETGLGTNSLHIHQYITGDALIGFSVGSSISSPTTAWLVGIDNSDSDKFKVSPNTNMGSSTSSSLQLSTTGIGGYGMATSANTSYKWTLEKNTASASLITTPSLQQYNYATWNGAGGVDPGWGIAVDFAAMNGSSTARIIGRSAYIFSDETDATEDVEFVISSIRAGALTENFKVSSLGKITLPETTNTGIGQAVLVGGTVTVNNSSVTANSRIILTRAVVGGTLGELSVGTITAGTSFVINSASGTETSTINYLIFN